MPLPLPTLAPWPRRARTLPLSLFFSCLPSLLASGVASGVITAPSGGFVSSGSLSESLPASLPGTVGAWSVGGVLGVTASQTGSVTLTYDYFNSSAGGMYSGQAYNLLLSVDDLFWADNTNILLASLTVTSTFSRCFANNAQPCGPSNPDPNAFLWSASTTFTAGSLALGTSAAPLHIVGGSSTSAQIPYSDTFALDLTSTMVFSGVNAGDVIHIDLPDTTEDDVAPEPATLSMAGLAVAAAALLMRRRRAAA